MLPAHLILAEVATILQDEELAAKEFQRAEKLLPKINVKSLFIEHRAKSNAMACLYSDRPVDKALATHQELYEAAIAERPWMKWLIDTIWREIREMFLQTDDATNTTTRR